MSEEWRLSFSSFLRDMGPRPGASFSIERVNVDGMYSAENCKWLPTCEQANNKRTNLRIAFNGHTKTLAEWSRFTGLPYATLQARLKRGWTADKAFMTPINESRRNGRYQPKNLQDPPL